MEDSRKKREEEKIKMSNRNEKYERRQKAPLGPISVFTLLYIVLRNLQVRFFVCFLILMLSTLQKSSSSKFTLLR